MYGILKTDATIPITRPIKTRELAKTDILAPTCVLNGLLLNGIEHTLKNRDHNRDKGLDLVRDRVPLYLLSQIHQPLSVC